MECFVHFSGPHEEGFAIPTCRECGAPDDADICQVCRVYEMAMEPVVYMLWLSVEDGVCPVCYTFLSPDGICPICKAEEELLEERDRAEVRECGLAGWWDYRNEEYDGQRQAELCVAEEVLRWEEVERRMAEYRKTPHLKVGDIIDFPGEQFGLVKIHSIGHYSYQVHLVYFDGYIKEYIEYSDTCEIEFEDDRLDYIKPFQAPTRTELPWPPDDVSDNNTDL